MNFKCPHCGTEYETAENDASGVVKCDICKQEFTIAANKPKLGLRKRGVQTSANLEDKLRATIDPSLPASPTALPTSPTGHTGLTAAEERIKMFEGMRNKMARAKLVRKLTDTLILLTTLAAVIGLILWWKAHKVKVAEENARIEAEAAAENLRLAEERDRFAREQREKDRLAYEAEQEKKRAEQARLEESRERARIAAQENKALYDLFMLAMRENAFDLFMNSVTNKLPETGGELCYLLPSTEASIPLYHAIYGTNGTCRVFRLDSEGNKAEIAYPLFQSMIAKTDYLVAKNGKVHFKSMKAHPASGVLSSAAESDPAETFFGSLAPALKVLKPTYEELTFDIFFTPKNSKRAIFVENIPFGGEWSIQHAHEAIADANLATRRYSGGVSRAKVPKFKRTVKFYGGAMIKQGVDGITYIPRMRPPQRTRILSTTFPNTINRTRTYTSDNNDSARWESLRQQALEEEQREKAYYEDIRNARRDSADAAREKNDAKFQKDIDDIFRNGTISFKIKKAQDAARR